MSWGLSVLYVFSAVFWALTMIVMWHYAQMWRGLYEDARERSMECARSLYDLRHRNEESPISNAKEK